MSRLPLKLYVFEDIINNGDYAGNTIVVLASNIRTARKLAIAEAAKNGIVGKKDVAAINRAKPTIAGSSYYYWWSE